MRDPEDIASIGTADCGTTSLWKNGEAAAALIGIVEWTIGCLKCSWYTIEFYDEYYTR